MAVEGVGVLVPAAGWATLGIELCDLSWVQSGPGAKDLEGEEIVKQEETGETPPHLGGRGGGGGGGAEMKRLGDLGCGGFLQPLRQDPPGRNRRRALQRWG